ncbi:hypothetical protein ACVW2L_000135 [Mucilaginibacter sp. HD30]
MVSLSNHGERAFTHALRQAQADTYLTRCKDYNFLPHIDEFKPIDMG